MRNYTTEERQKLFGRPGNLNPMWGKSHSKKTKRILRNRSFSESHKSKLSDAAIRRFSKNGASDYLSEIGNFAQVLKTLSTEKLTARKQND